ncbi:hypothetical protein ANO11243_035160 [Dothideomycetidae sp. 11243]|nr:hypothetical protein ANO11243_035160 [fungal sp. No.11243]
MHGSDDEYATLIAQSTSYAVLDVRYRLAPEDPFPAATNDAEDVVKWVLSQPDTYDPKRISVSGFSAGATLALGLAGHVFPKTTFQHAIIFYPAVDLTKPPSTRTAPDPSGKPIPNFVADVFDSCYTPNPEDRKSPLVSPALCSPEDFTAKMLFITCACDNLAPDAEELAQRIAAVPGNTAVSERFEGVNHAWDKQTKPGTPQAEAKDRAYRMALDMLAK